MEITAEIQAAALVYKRAGEVFTPIAGGAAVREIEGTLLGITEGSDTYAYTMYLNRTDKGEAVNIAAIGLADEEARIVLSAIVGVVGLADFPKYPRFSFSVPGYSRSIEVRYYTRAILGRAVNILAPTDITNKEVLSGVFRLINTALLREKYPLKVSG